MENQDLPEYKAIIKHRGDLVKFVRANISSITSKLRDRDLLTESHKDAERVVDDCILLSIEMAEAETKSAISAYHEFMSVLKSCGNKFSKGLIKKIEAKRKELYRELLSPRATGPDPSQKYQVFISYGREDTTNTTVDTIKDHLVKKGIEVFVDRSSLKPGDHWPAELVSAIRTSPVFIAVLTKKYISSHYCHGELYEAQALKKRLLLVVLEDGWDEEFAGIPVKEILSEFQCTSLLPGNDVEGKLDTLVESVAAHLDAGCMQTGRPVKRPNDGADLEVDGTCKKAKLGPKAHLDLNDLPKINEKLKNASPKWFELGLALHVDYNTLENIQTQMHFDNAKCLREMLATRLKSGAPLTWDILRTALRNPTVGRNDVASQI